MRGKLRGVRLFGLALCVAALLFGPDIIAQGNLVFRNDVSTPVFLCNGMDKVQGSNFVAQLYWAPAATGPWKALTNPPAPFRTGKGAGVWNPGIETVRTVGVPAGATVFLQVKVWEAKTGNYETSLRKGSSPIFSLVTGGAGNPPSFPANIIGPGKFTSFKLEGTCP